MASSSDSSGVRITRVSGSAPPALLREAVSSGSIARGESSDPASPDGPRLIVSPSAFGPPGGPPRDAVLFSSVFSSAFSSSPRGPRLRPRLTWYAFRASPGSAFYTQGQKYGLIRAPVLYGRPYASDSCIHIIAGTLWPGLYRSAAKRLWRVVYKART